LTVRKTSGGRSAPRVMILLPRHMGLLQGLQGTNLQSVLKF